LDGTVARAVKAAPGQEKEREESIMAKPIGNGKGDEPPPREPDEVLPNIMTAVRGIVSAEVDVQIATAKRFPRDVELFRKRALEMATVDEETAADCCYKLPPRKKRKDKDKPEDDEKPKEIEGPSIRLAEVVMTCWGNMRVQGMPIAEEDRFIVVRGAAWDLENNNAFSVDLKRRITGHYGRYSDDMIAVTTAAGISIAVRDAIFRVVPFTYVKEIYLRCKEKARGTQATLVERRTRAMKWFAEQGVAAGKVLAALGVRTEAEITLDHLETLNGYRTALREGRTTKDEIFGEAALATTAPDALGQIMADVGCDEGIATHLVALFDSLKMNAAARLVQCKAFKGKPDELADLLVQMGATLPEPTTTVAGERVNTTTGEVVIVDDHRKPGNSTKPGKRLLDF
jgi:hypothetical protein